MDPATILNLTLASISLAEQLMPVIEQLRLSGEITAEQQAEVRRRYESLKARADGQFQGAHWIRE